MTARKPPKPEVPATQPLLSESSTQRIAWERQIKDAQDEKRLIELQRESLVRINDVLKREAYDICEATICGGGYAN